VFINPEFTLLKVPAASLRLKDCRFVDLAWNRKRDGFRRPVLRFIRRKPELREIKPCQVGIGSNQTADVPVRFGR
jgi:hypothetical protein